MAGVLSFALGLESSAFATGLDRAGTRLLAFLSVGKGLEIAFKGIWGAIEHGAALNDLSARTGESVKNLYQLQEAFKVVGIGADAVPSMILRLQKALSGMTDEGESTERLFKAMGLDMDKLKSLDAPSQFIALGNALRTLNRESMAGAAAKLFGREGAGNMLQLTRDMQGFRDAITDSAAEAAVFARAAAAFDKVGDTISRIKGRLMGMWAGIAEGLIPQLQKALNWIKELDLVGLGHRIGSALATGFNLITSGRLFELLSLGLMAAIEKAGSYALATINGIGAAIGTVLRQTMAALQEEWSKPGGKGLGAALGSGIAANIYSALAAIDRQNAKMGAPGASKRAAQYEVLAASALENNAKAWGELDPSQIDAILKRGFSGSGKAFVEAFEKSLGGSSTVLSDRLVKLFQRFWTDSAMQAGPPDAPGKRNASDFLNVGKALKPDVTALEKIGFIFNSDRYGASAAAERTAQNTREAAEYAKKLYIWVQNRNTRLDLPSFGNVA